MSGDDVIVAYPLFQKESGGSLPTSPLHFSRCNLKDVSSFIKKNHYSHTYPGGVDYAFEATVNRNLVGACLFGYQAGNPSAVLIKGYKPECFRELMRLVFLDYMPKNSESKFIGWCLRWLKKNTNIVACVSFADPKYGHIGTIYKASNWKYIGLQKPDRPRIIIDGKEVHPRQCVSLYKTSSIHKLKEMGYKVEETYREPKHKYIYYLR